MSTSPAITVLVTVYNGAKYVEEAISSVLNQTLQHFELLIIDDASTDHSRDIILGFKDPRIRFIAQSPNRGIHATLNRGLAEAKAPLMAIMDQDDISFSTRLENQFEQFVIDPELAVCGTAIEIFGDNPGETWVNHFDPSNLKIALLFENPICHPSVMMNRAELSKLGLNYPNFSLAEEYALWVHASREKKIINLPEKLLRYRAHAQQVSRSRNLQQNNSNDLIIREQLRHLKLDFSPRDLIVHKLFSGGFNPIASIPQKTDQWMSRLVAANKREKVYDDKVFAVQLKHRKITTILNHQSRMRSMPLWQQLRWRLAVMLDYWRASASEN